jgi:hypothetical protein
VTQDERGRRSTMGRKLEMREEARERLERATEMQRSEDNKAIHTWPAKLEPTQQISWRSHGAKKRKRKGGRSRCLCFNYRQHPSPIIKRSSHASSSAFRGLSPHVHWPVSTTAVGAITPFRLPPSKPDVLFALHRKPGQLILFSSTYHLCLRSSKGTRPARCPLL